MLLALGIWGKIPTNLSKPYSCLSYHHLFAKLEAYQLDINSLRLLYSCLDCTIRVEIGLQRRIPKTGINLRSFALLLISSGSFCIHARNLQKIMTENLKSTNVLSSSLVWKFHEKKHVKCNLRQPGWKACMTFPTRSCERLELVRCELRAHSKSGESIEKS